MLHQASETSSIAESTAGQGYTDHAKQWAKGGAFLLGLGALGALGYRFLSWFSSNLHSIPLNDHSVKTQAGLQQLASIEELDANGAPALQRDVTYSPDTKYQASVTHFIDGTIVNTLATTAMLSSCQTNKTLSAYAAMSAFDAPVTDFKSVVANDLDADDSLTLEYLEGSLIADSDSKDSDTNIILAEDKSGSSLSCSSAMLFGLMGSLLTRNPLYLGAASLFCAQNAYGQIINGQIPDQLINVGDPFSLKINTTELFGEPVKNIMVSLEDGSVLPSWLDAGPTIVGNLVTTYAYGVAVRDNVAYVSDAEGGLKIIDVTDSSSPKFISSVATTKAYSVVINGCFAYVADGRGGLRIIDIRNSTNPILTASLTTADARKVIVRNNFAYLVDSIEGLDIIDVSNSTNPILTGRLTVPAVQGVGIVGNFAYGIAINDTLVYMAGEYRHFQIIDVSNSTNPILKSSSNTFSLDVAVSSSFAYVACADSGLKIIDVSVPTNPVVKYNLATTDAYGITIRNTLAYVADCGGGLKIVDISRSPYAVIRGSLVTVCAHEISIQGNLAYIADSDGGLKIADLESYLGFSGIPVISKQKYGILITAENYFFKKVSKSFFISTDYFPMPINSIISQSIMPSKTLTLELKADTLFQDKDVSDNFGLRIFFNSSDSLPGFLQYKIRPFLEGSFSTPLAHGIKINGSYAYLCDAWTGLKIFDVSDPTLPILKGNLALPAYGVTLSQQYAYLASSNGGGLEIVDVSDPTKPILCGSLPLPISYVCVINKNIAYVAASVGGLQIIDVSNSSNPTLKGSFATTLAYGVAVQDNLAYVADASSGLKIIDVTNVAKPVLKSTLVTTYANGLDIHDQYVYLADAIGGLKIIDVSDINHPNLIGKIASIYANAVTAVGNFAYLADYIGGGLKIIDISNRAHPILRGSIVTHDAIAVAIHGNLGYVSDQSEGLKIIDLTNYQITATPSHGDEGNYEIVVAATDPMFASTNISFVLRVEGAPRLMQPMKPQIALIGNPFSYFVPQGTFWDPNNDVITFEAQAIPSFLSFNPSSATFWGIPSDSDRGQYNITIFATDRITTPTPAHLNLLVHYAPTLNRPIENQVVDIGRSFIFTLNPNTFDDRDESFNLTYTAMQANQYPLPSWLHFNNQTQTFSGTPQESNQGTLALEAIADDGLQGRAIALFDLVVEHFPRLAQNFSTVYAAIGHSFAFNAFSYFVDIDGDTLLFSASSLGKGLPPGLVFDPFTCRFLGTPVASDRGSIHITLTSSDFYGGSVQTQFNLTVDDYTKIVYVTNPLGVTVENRLPVLAGSLLQQTFTAGVQGEFSVRNTFQDPDGDPLVFSADMGGADNWLVLDESTGRFSGTPSSSDAATYANRRYTIGVTATDPANKTAAGSFDILLMGPSLTEKVLNALFVVSGFAVAAYGYYQKKYLLWNWCRKSKYKKPDITITMGEVTGVIYHVNYPSNKIKSVIVTTIKDRKCLSRDSCCCQVFKNTDEYNLPVRISFHVFDWLLYDRTNNCFQVVGQGPDEEALQENTEIQIRGADNCIIEQFTVKVRRKNEMETTVAPLSDAPLEIPLEEKSSSSSKVVLMQSIGLFSTSSAQENESIHSSTSSVKTSALQTPLLNS